MNTSKTELEKVSLESMDVGTENRTKLKALFPSVFTETLNENGELVESIDFEKLKAELGTFSDLFECRKERYGMDWPGKKECLKIIQQPSLATLKPCREESVNFDTTENLFIEGDNLEVLKLLQKSYYGKVKMIYIDPPYNTGKEFIYPDHYAESLETYLAYAGLVDDKGKKFSTNTANEGRFHTKWLNMMYPRLYLARNLLREDGVIFISIDDHECANLRKICDDIFCEDNFLTQFTWKTDGNFDNQAKFKKCHEYILVYAKSTDAFPAPPVVDPNVPNNSKLYREEIRNTIVKNGPKNPISEVCLPYGFPADFEEGSIKARNNQWPNYNTDAHVKDGKLINEVLVKSGWSAKELLQNFIKNGYQPIKDSKEQETSFLISRSGSIETIKKRSTEQSHVISSITGLGGPQKASAELKNLGIVFDDYPKPEELIKYFLKMNFGNDFIVLDFFAGSCTTAHAILNLNAQDNGNRKFIMVQLPEKCNENSLAHKADYKTIAQIGKERIRRAIQRVREHHKSTMNSIDLGFKVLKLDKSNFKVWEPTSQITVSELLQKLEGHIPHIDPKASQEDILYELLLKSGYLPTAKIEKQQIAGKTVYSIGDGVFMICLESEITREFIEAVAATDPERFICLDHAFKGNDQLKANAMHAFSAHRSGGNQDVFRTI